MAELQEKDELGRVRVDDDGAPIPLSGAQLTSAAKKWAEDHQAVVTASVKDAEFEKLTAPVVPDRPPLDEVGSEEFARYYEGLETSNTPGGPQGYVVAPPGLAAPTDVPSPAPTVAPGATTEAAGSVPHTETLEGGKS
jgi:hypothetical protein